MSKMKRSKGDDPVLLRNVGTNYAGSETIDMSEFAGARLRIETGSAATLEVWECESENGTFGRSYIDGSAVSIALPDKPGWDQIPEKMFAAHFIRLVQGSGTITKVAVVRKS